INRRKMNEENYITLVDEDDTEVLAEILFTFDYNEENYVLLKMTNDYEEDELDIIAYKYEELEDGTIGNLIEISDSAEDEWKVVEEMLETFSATNFEIK
ncbi:MAG: DUF1292 domain-containing protein, partial [Bacilli bacterium]